MLPESTMQAAQGGKRSIVLPSREANEQQQLSARQDTPKVREWPFYLDSNQYKWIHTDCGSRFRRDKALALSRGNGHGVPLLTKKLLAARWYLLVKGKSVHAWYHKQSKTHMASEAMGLTEESTTIMFQNHCNFQLQSKYSSLYPQISVTIIPHWRRRPPQKATASSHADCWVPRPSWYIYSTTPAPKAQRTSHKKG